jgi:phosphomethylpyrimidine synthase
MRITEDVRRYAAEQGVKEEEAIERGLEEKAVEFAKAGEVYQKV